ncbi:MAG: leucyl aminopeptidase [Pseudomonadota bacterium]
MTSELNIIFEKLDQPKTGTVVVFAQEGSNYSATAKSVNDHLNGAIERGASAVDFTAKAKTSLDMLSPGDGRYNRVIVAALADITEYSANDWSDLGGQIFAKFGKHDKNIQIYVEQGDIEIAPEHVAQFALGIKLRSYSFDKHKTKKSEDDEEAIKDVETSPSGQDSEADNGYDQDTPSEVTILCSKPEHVQSAFIKLDAICEGVFLARDLVNEPSNILGPKEFADHAKSLESLGMEVEILDEEALKSLNMNALVAVGQGSHNPSYVAVMKWNGVDQNASKEAQQPIAFIGKGVTFDTGGISIKPASGMEDMKGDMAGAACVIGLMKALAGRKAKVNAIGMIGLVENMPGSNAQRPGDIVTSMSGQTIEVINTDAEGRLVLADMLWYAQEKYTPKFMINLATLTGAIIVALGHEYAGLFSNNDELVERLNEAGETTGEKVWRMPLHAKYDKLLESKFADMKNIGGRWAGSITAAQFLQRFVNKTPWAHIDIAGTGMSSPKTDINRSWGSGFGVRLLDEMVAKHYEV